MSTGALEYYQDNYIIIYSNSAYLKGLFGGVSACREYLAHRVFCESQS